MSAGLTTLLTAAGAVAAMLAVLVPVIRAQGTSLRREIDAVQRALSAQGETFQRALNAQGEALRNAIDTQGESLRREIDALRGDLGELRRDVHGLSDRVARGEGALTAAPRGPTNGSPAAPSKGPVHPPHPPGRVLK